MHSCRFRYSLTVSGKHFLLLQVSSAGWKQIFRYFCCFLQQINFLLLFSVSRLPFFCATQIFSFHFGIFRCILCYCISRSFAFPCILKLHFTSCVHNSDTNTIHRRQSIRRVYVRLMKIKKCIDRITMHKNR